MFLKEAKDDTPVISWEFLGLRGDQTSQSQKLNQPWIFIGNTDAEVSIIWKPDGKRWLIGKNPDVVKEWKQEEKGAPKDEIIR